MITVIVDTTATFVDVMMKSTSWMQLLTLCHGSRIDVVLPDVVLRETARHWETEALQAIQTANGRIGGIKKSREKLAELGIDGSSLVDSMPVTATPDKIKFEQATREKLVYLGVQVKPVPDHVDVETVLKRDLAGKRPFTKAGKGFRDTLVWETVKQVVKDSGPFDMTFLVTANSTDYCETTGALASDLLAEVENAGGIIRVPDLDELLKHPMLSPMVAELAQTDEQLAAFLSLATGSRGEDVEPRSVDQIVKDAVIQAIERLTGEDVQTVNEATSGHNFLELSIPAELEGLSIETIEPDESTLTWQTYETYQDSTLLIQAEIHAYVSLAGLGYKSDVVHLGEEVQVLDWDWNNHMAYVCIATEARLSFQIRLEIGMDFVEDCEFEGAQPITNDDPHQ